MASVYKVLGQSAPSATTNTDVYTVGSGKQAVISTIVIANRGSTISSFRLAVRPNGVALANQHYLAFDVIVGANDSTTLTLGITMSESDILTFRASSANLSVNVFGTEIS